MSTPTPPPPPSGPPLIGGRYELGELLGRGGMAEVRKGTDSRLGRVVAIKRLRTDLASDSTFQARFRREAQSAASLNHPAIVSVYDTGEELATDGSGVAQPYIVMEFVAGRTLRDILREGRKILPERALEITSGVLSALDYSHRAGIIHRDIKPGNVMLTPSGDVKVMDFGIARAMSDSNTMTQTAAVVGTAQYLSPEQARGETVDSRSDVYSAGCLLYELLTGRPPFVGDSPVAVAYQHVREQAAPPSAHDEDLPPAVDAIVMKALAKRLEDRYQSAAAMRSDIERYLAGRPVQAPAPVLEPDPDYQTRATVVAPLPTDSTAVRPPGPPPADERRAPRTGLLILLGLLVLALIVGTVLAFGSDLFESAPEQEQVPNLIGLTEDEARIAIGGAGLTVGEVDYEAERDRRQGRGHRAGPQPRPVRRSRDRGRPGRLHRQADGPGPVRRGPVQGRRAQPDPQRQARGRVRDRGVRRAQGSGRPHPSGRRGDGAAGQHRDRLRLRRAGEGAQRGRPAAGRGRGADPGRGLRAAGPRRQPVDRAGRHGDRPGPGRRRRGAGGDDHPVRVGLRRADAHADTDPDSHAERRGDAAAGAGCVSGSVARRTGRAGRRTPAR